MYQLPQTLAAAIAAGNPQRVLIEFTDYDPVVQFSNEDIVISNGLHLSEEFNTETDLTVGQCTSAEIDFAMWNDEAQLAEFEFGTFKAYLGARIDSGTPTGKTKTFTENGRTVTYEFAPLGVFVAERPDIVKKTVIEVHSNDRMTLFDVDMPSKEDLGITYPTTLSTLFQKMCEYLEVPYVSSTFLNSGITVSKEPDQFESATMREVLKWIAEAAGSNARFNRNGQLEFIWFNTVNKTYTESNYREFTPTWYETAAIDGLHIRNANSTTEYVVGTGENAYLIQDNPFLRQSD